MCRWNDWGKPCICVQQVKLFGKRCGGEGGRGERRIIACGIQCAGAIWGKVSLSSSKTRILQLSLWSSPAALQCTEAPHTLVELLLYYCWVIPSPPRCALDLARARNTYARGHSLTLMHTHTHTLSRSLSLSHAHTHSLSVSLSHALARTDFPAAFLVVPICEQLRCSTEWRQRPRQRNFFFHFDTKCEKELREIKYWSRSPEACSQNNNCLEMFLVGSCRRLKFFFSFEWKWSAPFPGLPVSNGLKLKLKFWKKKIKLKQKIKNSVGEIDRKKNCEREQKEVFSVNSGFRFPWDGQVWSDRSWAFDGLFGRTLSRGKSASVHGRPDNQARWSVGNAAAAATALISDPTIFKAWSNFGWKVFFFCCSKNRFDYVYPCPWSHRQFPKRSFRIPKKQLKTNITGKKTFCFVFRFGFWNRNWNGNLVNVGTFLGGNRCWDWNPIFPRACLNPRTCFSKNYGPVI